MGHGCFQLWPAVSRVVLDQLFCIMLDDLAAPPCGALERRVMDHHQLTIFGKMQVEFAAANAVGEALLETGQGVFRRLTLCVAVSID